MPVGGSKGRGPGAPLILGEKQRSHRRKESQQYKLNKPPRSGSTREYFRSLHATETRISSGLVGHLARIRTLPSYFLSRCTVCHIHIVYII